MASNGGPEEDPAVGVWKSLLEWECRAWGSAQRSAPETATGPSMPCAPKTLKVTRQHKFTSRDLPHTHSHTHTKKKKKPCRWHKETHFDCDRLAKAALQRRDLFLKMFPNVSRLSRANLMCCPPGSFAMSPRVFWKGGYLRQESTWSAGKKKTQAPTETKGRREVLSITPATNRSRCLGWL